jgi:hypothetical protein
VIRRSWRWRTRLASSCGRAWNFERLSKLRLENRGAERSSTFRAFRPDPRAMTGGLVTSKVNLAACRAALHRKRPEATGGEVHGDEAASRKPMLEQGTGDG